MYSQIKKKFNINFEKIVGNINKKENFIKFNKIKPDYVLSCSSQIIDKKYLKTKSKFINMHFSLLPNYRGFMPIFYSMINGENKIGISFHEMTNKIDQGMIYHRKAFSLETK